MTRQLLSILSLTLTGSAFAGVVSAPSGYVDSRAVTITCQTPDDIQIDGIHLWVSTDGAETWQQAEATRTNPNAVRFDAKDDGKYCFYIILENGAGCSATDPTPGTKPHLSLTVDTAPPTLQIHSARQTDAPDGGKQLCLDVSLVDEHLGEAGTRLFYRANADAGWCDAGPVTPVSGVITWNPPTDVPGKIDIRVAATDLAGNRAFDELRDVAIEHTEPTAPPVVETTPEPTLEPVEPLVVEPVTVAPVPPVTLTDQPQSATTTTLPPQQVGKVELLRAQAAGFLAEGRFALASARLHQALELAPDNADIQADLGSVLFNTRQYDRAANCFTRALDTLPDHLGAIEGLALVAVNQKRYSEARSHLQHLLRLSPEAPEHWVHLGDVQHMLGNVVDARAAWEKALQLEPADQTIREDAQKRLRLFGQSREVAK
jgi:predicted negative regulator of RcsB-dependent stress response